MYVYDNDGICYIEIVWLEKIYRFIYLICIRRNKRSLLSMVGVVCRDILWSSVMRSWLILGNFIVLDRGVKL